MIENINKGNFYEISLGSVPTDADIAFTTVSTEATAGLLNRLVIKSYGYNLSILKNLDLEKGFDLVEDNRGLKSILFIVTVEKKRKVEDALKENLAKSIQYYLKSLSNKKIWLPLMGTGKGGLSFSKSLQITLDVLLNYSNHLSQANVSFIISIPISEEGKALFNSLEQTKTIDTDFHKQKKQTPPVQQTKNVQKAPLKKQKTTKKAPLSEGDDFIEGFSGKFYLVGSSWGKQDKKELFFRNNTWENPYDEKYIDLVNNVRPGDILIMKSTFAKKNGKSYIRIKGFGTVMGNNNNGKHLTVDWSIKDLQTDIEGLGSYRAIISEPKKEHLLTILSQLDTDQRSGLSQSNTEVPSITTVTKITTIAGLVSDIDSGTDHLNISKDVSAFARVIAAKSFTPPLAIALFGKWGSGKSFFMKKLKERIELLSYANPEKGFCEGIAHVHFNAWSYMDANLWAGIITKIFEGLQQYISNNSPTDAYKKEIEEMLTSELHITNDELAKLKKEESDINIQLETLVAQKDNIEEELQQKIDEIENLTITKVIEKVNNDFQVETRIKDAVHQNPSIIKSKEELAKVIPREYWKNPDELYQQTRSTQTFLKIFFKTGELWKNLLWLTGIILIVVLVPLALELIVSAIGFTDFNFSKDTILEPDYSFTTKMLSLFTILGGLYTRGIVVYKKLQPLIASFWNIKKEYEIKKEDAIFSFKQKEKALQLEIEKIKDKIVDINQQINITTKQKTEIEFRLNNTLSTEALHTFIEKRSASKEYEEHLGIISIIRKDFEILSNLFTDHHEELENSKKIEDFREKFERPLQRIVLYIDDLDRCPEERVVEVLEAVNLLMAYPLFVVVVGVDPRWVKNALIKKHQLQFVKNEKSPEIEMIDPSSYLEKIFQVPFNLKAPADSSVKHMLKTLAEINPIISDEVTDIEQEEHVSIDDSSYTDVEQIENTIPTPEYPIKTTEEDIKDIERIETKETIESLQFSEQEIELLQDMSIVIGSSPRAIKRFINIYRIVKAHENFGYTNASDDIEILSVLFLLALPIGKYKHLTTSLFGYFVDESKEAQQLQSYFHAPIDQIHKKAHPLQEELLEKMSNSEVRVLLDQKAERFTKHLYFLKRFVFSGM
ncbi:P-loop NTPase fold protein [Aquimarina algiphila]|uniref:P-loop NTPase fold protein n=1 Tax=Aquimarina algiphila TaxID=2047982 RepID=UPI0024913AC5|nr:P-loop NTPase fold protein [Aquimarina algiphila]